MIPPFILQARNITKSFPGVKALESVNLDVAPGEVHALIGENGAGKSTLMKILIGIHTPDAGEILFKGRGVRLKSPHDALKQGAVMIHQELLLFPDLTIAENIFMGQEAASHWCGWLDKRAMNRESKRLLERLGVVVSPSRKMKQLSVAEMQIVEIARALVHSAEVIIMDEPTSALSKREVEALFELIRELKAQGVAVIYISHKLEEIFRIADRVTILRDGCCAATQGIRELNERRLIALMVGRELEPDFRKPSVPREEVALSVRGLGRTGKFHNVHFEVRQGEILGIAGLMGAGRTDLVSTLFGLAQPDAGEIRIRGRRVWLASPREALQNGIALVSENRKEYGLVLKMSVQHNLTLSSLQRCCQRFFIDRRRESQIVDEQIRAFSIKTPSRNQPSIYLSGGNQQKVVIAKMLLTDPSILILDEPTCGVDVGAKAELYAIITQLARNGKAILMVSSDLREILALSDRILVMREGDITAHLDPRQTSQEEVLQYALPQ